MPNRKDQIGRLARIACALALLLIGFAHQPPRLHASVPSSEVAAYMLPDGTLPPLCDLALADDDDHGGLHDHGRCEACLLSASTLLPPPPALAFPPLRLAETLPLQNRAAGPAMVFRLTAAPRGPPALSFA